MHLRFRSKEDRVLRIAFSGSGGTGKTTLAEWLADFVYPLSSSIVVLPSATRFCIDSLGYSTAENGDSWMSLHSATVRKFWIASSTADIVISERCVLDEVAYQSWYLDKCRNEGNMFEFELGMSIQHILLQQALNEVLDTWDYIYVKRPLEGVKIEDDGVRSTSKEYQLDIDEILVGVIGDMIQQIDIASEKILVLPPDNEDCKEFLKGEMSKWQTKFQS